MNEQNRKSVAIYHFYKLEFAMAESNLLQSNTETTNQADSSKLISSLLSLQNVDSIKSAMAMLAG